MYILYVYPVDYNIYPVRISCGLQCISCTYILWDTMYILYVYPVGYNVYPVRISCRYILWATMYILLWIYIL